MELDFSPVWAGLPQLLAGALVTVEITAASLLLGCAVLAKVTSWCHRHMCFAQQTLGPGKTVVGVCRYIGVSIKRPFRLCGKLEPQWRKCRQQGIAPTLKFCPALFQNLQRLGRKSRQRSILCRGRR